MRQSKKTQDELPGSSSSTLSHETAMSPNFSFKHGSKTVTIEGLAKQLDNLYGFNFDFASFRDTVAKAHFAISRSDVADTTLEEVGHLETLYEFFSELEKGMKIS